MLCFQYITEDLSGNKASCVFSVTVLGLIWCKVVSSARFCSDTQPPVIDFCESPPEFITLSNDLDIEWDEPLFHDNSKLSPSITQSHSFGRFPFGETDVTYTATDSSGNSVSCHITIKLSSIYNLSQTVGLTSAWQVTPALFPTIQLTGTRTARRTSRQFIAPWPVSTDTLLPSDPPGTTLVRWGNGIKTKN